MVANNINILLIEDNPDDIEIIKHLLEKEKTAYTFTLKSALNIVEGLNYLNQEVFDVVLLDLILPDSDGIDLDSFIKINENDFSPAIVILTELDSEEVAVRLVQMGAQDYLVKEFIDSNLLVRSIIFAIERQQIIEQLKWENVRRIIAIKNEKYDERNLRLALDNIHDIVIEIDNDNVCIFINKSGINFFGSEIIGNKFELFYEGIQELNEKLESIGKNDVLVFKYWQVDRNGEKRLFNWTCNFLISEKDEKEGFLLIAHDITSDETSNSPPKEKKHKMLGQLLLEKGYINEQQLENALTEQKKTQILLGEILIRLGYITPEDLADVLIMQAESD